MTRRALVTGGAGFLGAHLTKLLLRRGWEVVVVDHGLVYRADNFEYLGIAPETVTADLSDTRALEYWTAPIPDAIFHLAGNANVALSVESPRFDFEHTLRATLNVLEFARRHRVPKVVFPSSASIYRPGAKMPVDEDAAVRASSPYGAAKVGAENYCSAYATSYGLNVTVLRFFSVYGPLMRRFVIHDMVRKLQQDPSVLEILGDGEQIRDYLFVEDAAQALLLAAEKGEAGAVYNVGTGVPIRIRELAETIVNAMGLTETRLAYTMKSWPGDVPIFYANIEKISRLGFTPRVQWTEGLKQTVRYLLAKR